MCFFGLLLSGMSTAKPKGHTSLSSLMQSIMHVLINSGNAILQLCQKLRLRITMLALHLFRAFRARNILPPFVSQIVMT